MHQATAREALSQSSQRFESIQQLINAIPAASDQKGILDLQARISAEQGMLMNEHIKLYVLNQAAQAERHAQEQRRKEEALAAMGSWRDLHPLGWR